MCMSPLKEGTRKPPKRNGLSEYRNHKLDHIRDPYTMLIEWNQIMIYIYPRSMEDV